MLTVLIFYVIVSIISASFLLLFMKNAPSGWEDENGFHINMKNVGDFRNILAQKEKIKLPVKNL